jgi:signal transduction histidine kinase
MDKELYILVVDDDEVDRMAIRRHLNNTGFNIELSEVTNAREACHHLELRPCNCIFLDYRLPDMDGVSLVKQLREGDFLAPIIVLTGQGDEQIAVNLMKAGASDYLAKSRLSPDNIASLIRNSMKVYQAEKLIRSAQNQLRQTNELLRQQNQELEDQRRQIEQQNLQLLEANRLKSEFLAIVTHELRTPLNAIMGFSQILKSQSKGSLNSYQLSMVSRIYANGENLLNLVSDILDMSTLEANRLNLEPAVFNIDKLVRSTVAELTPLAEEKNLGVELKINLNNPQVFHDQYRLKQVLVNLVSNAIKFTDKGHIRVKVNSPSLNAIQIVVEDTGIGIHPSQLNHIFKPFRQADQTSKRHHSGTGLGLAITHSLVSLMEGFMTVESEVGQGTTFIVQIPRETGHPEIIPQQQASIPAREFSHREL